jgi:hypothetical protein
MQQLPDADDNADHEENSAVVVGERDHGDVTGGGDVNDADNVDADDVVDDIDDVDAAANASASPRLHRSRNYDVRFEDANVVSAFACCVCEISITRTSCCRRQRHCPRSSRARASTCAGPPTPMPLVGARRLRRRARHADLSRRARR